MSILINNNNIKKISRLDRNSIMGTYELVTSDIPAVPAARFGPTQVGACCSPKSLASLHGQSIGL